jgi:hypothetical protein
MDTAIFAVPADISFECLRVGHEAQPMLVVDSLFAGAKALRELAINSGDFSIIETYYPGLRMPLPPVYSVALLKNLAPIIERHFECSLANIKKAASRFSIVTTPPAELELLQRIPHIDAPTQNSLAIVHYLVDRPDAGTALYRHRATGYEYIDAQRYSGYMATINQQFPEPSRYPTGYICGDTNEFEMLAAVGAKFNRMVMYRAASLHSGMINADYNFDPNPATGRLTITTFVEFKE